MLPLTPVVGACMLIRKTHVHKFLQIKREKQNDMNYLTDIDFKILTSRFDLKPVDFFQHCKSTYLR